MLLHGHSSFISYTSSSTHPSTYIIHIFQLLHLAQQFHLILQLFFSIPYWRFILFFSSFVHHSHKKSYIPAPPPTTAVLSNIQLFHPLQQFHLIFHLFHQPQQFHLYSSYSSHCLRFILFSSSSGHHNSFIVYISYSIHHWRFILFQALPSTSTVLTHISALLSTTASFIFYSCSASIRTSLSFHQALPSTTAVSSHVTALLHSSFIFRSSSSIHHIAASSTIYAPPPQQQFHLIYQLFHPPQHLHHTYIPALAPSTAVSFHLPAVFLHPLLKIHLIFQLFRPPQP